MIDSVNIGAIPYKVLYREDIFTKDSYTLGQLNPDECVIYISKSMSPDLIPEVLCHEIMHAILFRIGQNDLSNDEAFVSSLSNMVNQTFTIKAS